MLETVRKMVESGKTHQQIAEALGKTKDWVAHFCSRHRLLRRKAPESRIDLVRLRELHAQDVQNAEIGRLLGCSESAIERWSARLGLRKERTGPKGGERHTNWKGGRVLVGRYWYRHAPRHPNATKHGYVLEHRLLAEEILGRQLRPEEVVHHRDGNPQNNEKTNLEIFATNADHLRERLKGNPDHGRRIAEGLAKARLRRTIQNLSEDDAPEDIQTSDRQKK